MWNLTDIIDYSFFLSSGILLEIVSTQNAQIQTMYDYLDAKRFPEKDNCDVFVDTIPDAIVLQRATGGGSSAGTTRAFAKWTIAISAAICSYMVGFL